MPSGGAAIRLIAVTGYAASADVEKSVQAGFDGHVAKPPDLQKIQRMLG